ncbi:MAG: hypothetical protein JWL86_5046 [Rhizobium sp.]|nr:hypothetical protein [Rhizobium sp.]
MAFARAASRQLELCTICPIRKCRRDGFCSGPLVASDGGGMIVLGDNLGDRAAGTGMPACHLMGDDAERERLLEAMRELARQVGESESGTMWETTRVIASRRWRKIEFADMVASAEAS